MSEFSLERQTVPLSTVLKWLAIAVSITFSAAGALYKLDSLSDKASSLEARVINIENNVLWRRE